MIIAKQNKNRTVSTKNNLTDHTERNLIKWLGDWTWNNKFSAT